MGLRLVISLEGGNLRVPLPDGEHVVGSDPACSVVLPHASVSRRHARLIVRGDMAEVEDLGSANGVIIGSRRIRREAVGPGQLLYFGRVSAVLEQLAAGDLAIGLPIRGVQAAAPAGKPVEAPQSTVVLAPVERFAIDELPQILKIAASTHDIGDVARAAGKSLIAALGCSAVEIVRVSARGEGILFDGQAPVVAASAGAVVEHVGPSVRVRATFDDQRTASLFSPVVESVAWLIGLTAAPAARLPGATRAGTFTA